MRKKPKVMDIDESETVSVSCWTKDVPELIGEMVFKRNDDGSVAYGFDDESLTL